MKIRESVTELIGNTPLLRLRKIEKQCGAKAALIAKVELFNPGGSAKDRVGWNMIRAAEEDGRLKTGGTIIEPTSGNTGVGIAMVAAAKRISGDHDDAGKHERRTAQSAEGLRRGAGSY